MHAFVAVLANASGARNTFAGVAAGKDGGRFERGA